MANFKPDGFRTVTPHIIVKNSRAAIDFYRNAFGAEELSFAPTPDGGCMHAEIKIGDSVIMLNDEFPKFGVLSPLSRGGSSVVLHLYVPDADAAFKRAVDAGATVKMPPTDMFWGDRYCQVIDASGHQWSIATHKEDVPPQELVARAQKAFAGKDCG